MIPGQTSPDFPPEWTAAVADAAKAHALEGYPNEVAGIVVDGEYIRLENRASNPETMVVLNDGDLIRVASDAQIFFHSHADSGVPSAHDMEYQQQLGIPFVIMSVQEMDVFCFGDQCPTSPLLGRGFRHGVHDCYALVRDWFKLERGLTLKDGGRDWEWWTKGQNLYMDNFVAAGFQEIPAGERTRVGDVFLFRFNYKVPMHAALVHSDAMLLHHPAAHRPVDKSRLSVLVPRQRWLHLVAHRMRHSDVA